MHKRPRRRAPSDELRCRVTFTLPTPANQEAAAEEEEAPPQEAGIARVRVMPAADGSRLTVANAEGRGVLVPRRVWPEYECNENGGAGWDAVVVRAMYAEPKTAVAVGVGGLAVSGVLGLAGLTHNMLNDELGAMVHPVNVAAIDRARAAAQVREAAAAMVPAV